MKVIKVMKKLKFWSSKKRKRRYSSSYDTYFDLYNHYKPPISYHHSSTSASSSTSYSPQPSAPPLPPWLEEELTHQSLEPVQEESETSSLLQPETTPLFDQQCIDSDSKTSSPRLEDQLCIDSNLDNWSPRLRVQTTSYERQQHVDSDSVLELPVVQTNIEKKSNDVIEWLRKSGLNFVVCVFPCFSIRDDEHEDRLKLFNREKGI